MTISTIVLGLFLVLSQMVLEKAHASYVRTFYNPKVNGIPMDFCYSLFENCGYPAANAYCHYMGYQKAIDYSISHNVGYTYVFNSKSVCESPQCDGFYWIRCITGGDHDKMPINSP